MGSGELRSPDVQVSVCPTCGSPLLERLRARTDGVWVLRCQACTMGVVEHFPRDLSVLYGDSYYQSGAGGPSGYLSYEAMAAHGTMWAAQLVRLLQPGGGRVLDVGCADGYLLDRLDSTFEKVGIEVNTEMAAKCRTRSINVIGRDLLDSKLIEGHAGRFDVVTAIAVLEHLPDLRGGLEGIRRLLKPGGVAVVELPLLTDGPSDETWFSSSLEHVFYPTEAAIQRVCSAVFGIEPTGGEARVEGYAATWVGLLTSNPEEALRLQELRHRVFDGSTSELTGEEKAFRFLFDAVHLARPTPENVALLAGMHSRWLRPELLARITSLWSEAVVKAQSVPALEAARDFQALQAQNWQQEADNRMALIKALEEARDFHALQARNWQREYDLKAGDSAEKKPGS